MHYSKICFISIYLVPPLTLAVLVYISISKVRGRIYALTPKNRKYLHYVTKKAFKYYAADTILMRLVQSALSTRFCRRCRRRYLLDDVHRLLALGLHIRCELTHDFLNQHIAIVDKENFIAILCLQVH